MLRWSMMAAGLGLVAALLVGAGYAFQWDYRDVHVGSAIRSVRVNRWTGETQRWVVNGWAPDADPVVGQLAP